MDNTYLDNEKKNTCNGCGVCALLCPKKCIEMVEDEEGFLYPKIDKKKCIKCKKCEKVCGNINTKKEENEKAYLAINKSKEQLDISSSGGMFYILAQYVINKKGIVFGVTYNNELEVVHDYSETMEDCKKFCGSKYVRSNLNNSFQKVKTFLDEGRYVLFTGTACQISGLKRYLQKENDNLILCDILCHANPSPKVFKLYIKNLEKIKNKKISNVLFRSKENGWRNQNTIIKYLDGTTEENKIYYSAFVKELINRPSCTTCHFASQRRISDFTIGDFWGYEKIMPNIDEKDGVSLLTVNSSKGAYIFNEISKNMKYFEVNYNLICSFNHYKNVVAHKKREKFFKGIAKGKINENNIMKYMKKYTKKSLCRKIYGKLKRIIKKILKF